MAGDAVALVAKAHERYEQHRRELRGCGELGCEREKQAWSILMVVFSGTS
jgi:hypothetical protein